MEREEREGSARTQQNAAQCALRHCGSGFFLCFLFFFALSVPAPPFFLNFFLCFLFVSLSLTVDPIELLFFVVAMGQGDKHFYASAMSVMGSGKRRKTRREKDAQ